MKDEEAVGLETTDRPVLDHIGIAVRSLDAAKVYETMGLTIDYREAVESQGVKTAFLSVGETSIELLEPMSPDSPVGRFIEKRGEGIHHLCFRVTDIETHLRRLENEGYRLINPSPMPGARGSRVAFLHPRGSNGVLIELSEKAGVQAWASSTGNAAWTRDGERS